MVDSVGHLEQRGNADYLEVEQDVVQECSAPVGHVPAAELLRDVLVVGLEPPQAIALLG